MNQSLPTTPLGNLTLLHEDLIAHHYEDDHPPCPIQFKVALHVPAILICFFIVSVNSFVLAVFVRSKNLRKTPSNYLLVSLSVNDLISGLSMILHILPHIYERIKGCMGVFDMFQLPYFVATDMITIFLLLTTVSHLLLLSSERFISLFWALRYKIIITRLRIFIVIFIAWLLGFTVTIVQLAWVEPFLSSESTYEEMIHFEKIHMKTTLICFAFVPSFILILQYTWLFLLIRRLIKTSLGISAKERYQKQRKALILYCIMFVSFVIFCVPYLSLKLIISVNEPLARKITPELLEIIFLIRFLVSVLNPLLYTLYNKDFRRATKLFFKFLHGKNFYPRSTIWRSTTDQTSYISQTDGGRLSNSSNRSRSGSLLREFTRSKIFRHQTKETLLVYKNPSEEDRV